MLCVCARMGERRRTGGGEGGINGDSKMERKRGMEGGRERQRGRETVRQRELGRGGAWVGGRKGESGWGWGRERARAYSASRDWWSVVSLR